MSTEFDKYFIKMHKHILHSDGFYSPTTGEAIALSLYDKLIYAYMLDKQTQFAMSKGMVHFESQSTIADYTRLSRKTINRTLTKFIDHGVVVAAKKVNKMGGLPHWEYTAVKHPLKTWIKQGGEIQPLTLKPPSKPVQPILHADDEDIPDWAK